tara:strand:- start:154 stop:543 length:390 start_codon:yes stop_codon:yes gene_type:complete
MKTLFIIRGLPGSGKSTLAEILSPECSYSADDHFVNEEGDYVFKQSEIKTAHITCQAGVEFSMMHDAQRISVANTFSQQWEIKPYLNLAAKHDYQVSVIECQNDFGSIHNVPDNVVTAMAYRWEKIPQK